MVSYPTRKTKNGTVYDVRFRIVDKNGIEVQKRLCGFQTKHEAQQAFSEFMNSYSPPEFKRQNSENYAFETLLSLYKQKTEAELAVSSNYDVNLIFNRFITPFFEKKNLQNLKKADYVLWQTNLWTMKNPKTGEFYKQKYLTKIRSVLMTFLNWCEETFDIPNLYQSVKKPKRKELKTEMKFWELNDFLKFQNSIDKIMWKTFFMCLFYSGCRVGELLALSHADLTFEKGCYFLSINKGITRKTANTDDKFLVTAPKTERSNRRVQLPKVMTEQIKGYLAYKKSKNISAQFLFYGDAPIPQRTYQRYFAYYTGLAGLQQIRIHDLRHSHASMLIHLNVPITVISKRLGHSSVKMTLEKYSHCYSNGETLAVSAINNAVKSK